MAWVILTLLLLILPSITVRSVVQSVKIPYVRLCCNSNNENTNANCVRVNERSRSELTCIPYSCTHKSILQLNITEDDEETRIISLQSCLLLRTEYLNICNNPTMPLNSTINELEIFNNGNLTYENRTGYKYSWPPDKYCINSSNTEESVSLLLQDTNEKTIIYICLNATGIPHTDDDHPAIIWLYLVITSIAAFILLFTMICFILSSKKQNIHGWTQFTHVLAFFLLMVFWNLDDSSRLVENTGTFSCKFIAIGSHFFYISLFSWLLTVNYDLLRAFRMPGQMEFRSQVNPFSRYLLYSSFGWGVPCFVVTLGILCSLAFDCPDKSNESLLSPMYGVKSCSLSFRAYWVFLIFPTAILLSLVFIIFIKMVIILERQRRSSARRKATTVVGMKIIFLMGPFWFLDLILMIHLANYGDEFTWYILIFDIIVIYQAVPLFVIYICRPDTLLYLQDHYPRLKKLFIRIGKLFCVQYPEEQSSSYIELDTKLRINRRPSISVPSPNRPKRVTIVCPPVFKE